MTALPAPPLAKQVGYLRKLFVDPRPVLDELNATYGPMVGMGMGPVRMAVVGDPTAMRELFALPLASFRWGHKFNALGFFVGEESMIVSDGEDHHRRRASVQSAFARRNLNSWIPMIVAQADTAIDDFLARHNGSAAPVDLYPVGRSILLNVMVRSLLGDRMSGRADEFGELFLRPQQYLESPAYKQVPHRFPFTKRSGVRNDRRALDRIVDAEVAYTRAHPVEEPTTILESIAQDATLSDGEIRDQLITLVGAGYDTTSSSLAWTLVCAARTAGLWDALAAEAANVFDGPADEATLAALTLAARTTREVLRLHPAGAIAPREAAVNVTVGGYEIPKGTLILWSAHLAGRDRAAWDRPEVFDPDRFLNPSPEQKELADLAWLPFGRGARNCIGFALAQMELTLITARLAQRLIIEPVNETEPRAIGMVVNRPEGGALLRVSER